MDMSNSTLDVSSPEAVSLRSCCFELDRKATVYFSQLIICVMLMVFCMVQLVMKDECEAQQIYIGLLTMVIGLVLPSPMIRKSQKSSLIQV